MSDSESDKSELDELLKNDENVTFKSLGLCSEILEITSSINWKKPTKIQAQAIPHALNGNDVVGLAETGSGKTGAFVLPILEKLLIAKQRKFALCMAPTRELALQINEEFRTLGSNIGIKTVCIYGGVDMMEQAMQLSNNPHVIIATPGRLVDHLKKTKGFNLKSIKFLVLDEADKMLDQNYQVEVDTILSLLPRTRQTLFFSATMTKQVKKLQRAALNDPIKVSVSKKNQAVQTLKQFYCFVPKVDKETLLVWLLNENQGKSIMVFCNQCNTCAEINATLRILGFESFALFGKGMTQDRRSQVLNKFRSKKSQILVATDVASRGLNIPHVDLVINYDISDNKKTYIHRVGRTARAGKSGVAATLVTQYDIQVFQELEAFLKIKLEAFPSGFKNGYNDSEVELLKTRVSPAIREARSNLKEIEMKNKSSLKNNKRKHGLDPLDDSEQTGILDTFKRTMKGSKNGKGKRRKK